MCHLDMGVETLFLFFFFDTYAHNASIKDQSVGRGSVVNEDNRRQIGVHCLARVSWDKYTYSWLAN